MKKKRGKGRGGGWGLKERGVLNNFLPLKRGGLLEREGLIERGGLNRGFTVRQDAPRKYKESSLTCDAIYVFHGKLTVTKL